MLNKYVFRGYDIRGVYPTDIDSEFAFLLGKGFGSKIQDLGFFKCVIGYDNRLSSPELSNSLIKGLISTGVDVINLGLVTTPMYYYALMELDTYSGIMVTASHNPKDDNGFKMAYDKDGNIKGDTIQELYEYITLGNFREGSGVVSNFDIRNNYLELFKKSLSFGDRKLKVVIDPGNGTTSIIAKELYSLFPMELISICDVNDGTFPNHHPDPCVESNLAMLKNKVLETGADIGLAFDGDGDRVGIIDELGNYIPTDLYMIIMIRNMINKVSNKTFLYDVKCSKALEDEIVKLGGVPYCYRTGNSYTKSETARIDAPLGGELSGHVYFRDKFPGFDSGLYAGLRIVELLSNSDKALSSLLEGIEEYHSTDEIKIKSPDNVKNIVVSKVKEYADSKAYSYLDIDGIKVLFDDSWALIRVSNTGPNITVRFEAKTNERLEQLQEEFMAVINVNNIEII